MGESLKKLQLCFKICLSRILRCSICSVGFYPTLQGTWVFQPSSPKMKERKWLGSWVPCRWLPATSCWLSHASDGSQPPAAGWVIRPQMAGSPQWRGPVIILGLFLCFLHHICIYVTERYFTRQNMQNIAKYLLHTIPIGLFTIHIVTTFVKYQNINILATSKIPIRILQDGFDSFDWEFIARAHNTNERKIMESFLIKDSLPKLNRTQGVDSYVFVWNFLCLCTVLVYLFDNSLYVQIFCVLG